MPDQVGIKQDGGNIIINTINVAVEDAKAKREMAFASHTAKLPVVSGRLFGREAELAMLDKAWEDKDIHMQSVVAFGGVGKSALTWRWLKDMESDNWRGAERVFGWSFYNQGQKETAETSAEPFIHFALNWFGDPNPLDGAAEERAARLVALIRAKRTLLILDGLEPMQNAAPGVFGRIKDPGLAAVVRELALDNPGLCLIATRVAVADVEHFDGAQARVHDLQTLSKEAGASILRAHGVEGMDVELEQASEDFGGHGLALDLLGKYLKRIHGGDVRKRDKVKVLKVDEKQGGHARRMMESYEPHLGDAERAILRLLGLFDRPAEWKLINVVAAAPAIEDFTEHLVGLGEEGWAEALATLRDERLLLDGPNDAPLDAHPLVREHFGAALKRENEAAWKEAHSRLYDHLRDATEDLPDTLDGLAPLYQAVAHGCAAGRYAEAFDEVYWRRIMREDKFFATRELGGYGPDLGAAACFFETPWSKPVEALEERERSWLLNAAGLRLRTLGRFGEAAAPMAAGLESVIAREDWKDAAVQASSMSQHHLALGAVPLAEEAGARAVELAERGGDAGRRMINRTVHADALHQAGGLDAAEVLFREAEAMQKEFQPGDPILYSLQGFRYCDLLLARGRASEARERARDTRVVAEGNIWLLDIALDALTIGRAHLAEGDADAARTWLDRAVDGLRRAHHNEFLPRGLLARAALGRTVEDFDDAERDLDEAWAIAERGPMRLHMADAQLEWARLRLAQNRVPDARDHLDKARALIDETGYHRRDADVIELEAALGS